MLKAALYARYSFGLQKPTSIEDQLALCRSATARFDCEILPDHIYTDRELSGSEEHRGGYQRLLAAARARAFDAILVESQDRLWRDQGEMHSALRRLLFWGTKVFSVAAGTELTSKTGRLLASVMGWKDEAYLEDLRDKTHRGLAGAARRGFSAGGRTYGYRTEPLVDPTQLDAHGVPRILGYRRIIRPGEAAVVRRIFELYAAGWSPKRIVKLLNKEGVAPPRGRAGWTWTAIYGSRRLGTGILRNRLYTGENTWNRFRWERNPETGARVPRLRSHDEWIISHDERLRIIPQHLWDQAKRRQQEAPRLAASHGHRRGITNRYLFSGLLVCGVCGAHFVMRSGQYYACSFHVNRGPSVCKNTRGVKRSLLEKRFLQVIREELFSPDAVTYITQRVNESLRAEVEGRRQLSATRGDLEVQLRDALTELDHIREAIRRGLLSDLTRQMLDEAESRVRQLRARLDAPGDARLHALRVLPGVIQQRLEHLDRVLQTDVDEAREALRHLLGDIVVRPTPVGLVAELQGNVEGLLSLAGDQTLIVGTTGSGGRI